MKKFLIIVGVLAILVVLVVGFGGYFMYKKGTSMISKVGQEQVEKFISTKNPPEPVSNSLRRIMNGVKMQSTLNSTILIGMAMGAIEDGKVTSEEATMLDEAAPLSEQKDLDRQTLSNFMMKYKNVMPRRPGNQ